MGVQHGLEGSGGERVGFVPCMDQYPKWDSDGGIVMLSRVSFPAPQIACNVSLFLQGKRKQRRLAYFNYWN